ncbi:MAG: hypothetical protein ABIL37_05615 [candidate division WOR-3 bacterium]
MLMEIENEIKEKFEKNGIRTINDIVIKVNDLNKIRIEEIVAFINPPTSINYQRVDIDYHSIITLNYQIYLVIQNFFSNEKIKTKFYETLEKLHLEFQKFKVKEIIESNLKEVKFEDFSEEANLLIYSLFIEIKAHKKEVKKWQD